MAVRPHTPSVLCCTTGTLALMIAIVLVMCRSGVLPRDHSAGAQVQVSRVPSDITGRRWEHKAYTYGRRSVGGVAGDRSCRRTLING
jgi:hypothetical protein